MAVALMDITSAQQASADAQNWRSLLLLTAYRWAIAIFLAATYYSGQGGEFFGPSLKPGLFQLACISYLLLCIPITMLAVLRLPRRDYQLYTHALVDLTALTVLVYAAGGVGTGLGMLFITPVAGLSILLPRRLGVLIGALATLALLGEEAYRYLTQDSQTTDFIQTGMLGLSFLFAAFVANTLSRRATASEALAARRKVALDSLAQINEHIIAHMQIGVLVVNADGGIRLLNQAACQLLGVRPSASGKLLATIAPALTASLEAWRRKPMLKNDPVTTEADSCILLAHFNRLGAEETTPTLIFIEDASRVGEQAQQMKLAALGRLTASIAHEIRNPLAAISHANQLLSENGPTESPNQRLLEIINRHTARINTIVENVLRLSRRGNTAPETLRLRPWLEQVAHDYRESRPIAPQIDCEMVSPAVEVRADPDQLRQVLYNLWDNAIHHAGVVPERLLVQLSAELWPESGRAHLDIYDNGRGIPPALAANVFEPFYTTAHSGTGLGLYIARELCECNHAKLSLVHGSTLGACFRIVFANSAEWIEQDRMIAHITAEHA